MQVNNRQMWLILTGDKNMKRKPKQVSTSYFGGDRKLLSGPRRQILYDKFFLHNVNSLILVRMRYLSYKCTKYFLA